MKKLEELTNLEWYKLIIWAYSKVHVYDNVHKHHIKPKCLYPELAEDEHNIIQVPAIVHWALHKLLFNHYVEVGNEEAVSKLKHVDLETFINDGQKNYAKNHPTSLYDFSKANKIMFYIKFAVFHFAVSMSDYSKAYQAYRECRYKKLKDMLDEEKEERNAAKELEKKCLENVKDYMIHLKNISKYILKDFGIKIIDELEQLSDKDVYELISSDLTKK